VSHSTLALVAVPFATGAIGYVTNWTGVLMLFYPEPRRYGPVRLQGLSGRRQPEPTDVYAPVANGGRPVTEIGSRRISTIRRGSA
jgi:hypothetical protein